MAMGTSKTSDLQVVVFDVAGQQFGLEIASISEIIRLDKITPVPRAPAYVEGVIHIRGAVIPAVNIHALFNMPAGERGENNRVVIVETGTHKFGLIVDAVHEVKKMAPDMVKPAPPALSVDQQYLKGIILDGENLVIYIEPRKLLSEQDMQVLQELEESS